MLNVLARCAWLPALGLAISALASAQAAAPSTGIAPFLSAPYADDLTTSQTADLIGWSELREGTRSLWVAAAPDFSPRRIVYSPQDDGQRMTKLVFSPDNQFLYFVRGGDKNKQGRNPNPASLTAPTEQAIWRVPVAGGAAVRIGIGAAPSVHPVSGDLYFKRDGDLYRIVGEALAAGRFDATRVLSVRSGLGEIAWAPDGKALLFVSARGDHAFVGIWSPGDEAVTWAAPDISRDMYPVWSPDSHRIAFIRVPGADFDEYEDFSRDWPFAVWIYDVETKQARAVWISPNPAGSQYEWQRTRPLIWDSNGSVILVSEHEGWLHGYRIDAATGAARDLTPGDCELWGTNAHPVSQLSVISTNCGDIDRRHLWRTVAGKKAEPLTRGSGIEVEPKILPSGRFVAYARADAALPQGIYVVPATGGADRRVSQMPPATFLGQKLVAPVSVSFPSADASGATVHGQIFSPDAKAFPGKRPVVIFLHGGPIRQTVAGWYNLDYYDHFYAINQYLLAKGYAVLSVNYRAGIGYGRDYRMPANLGPKGASEYPDIVGAAHYLQSRGDVDASRIGIYGGSYGGYLASLALARNSDVFKAGVIVHGVHDWSWHSDTFLYSKGAGWSIVGAQAMKTARASSPVANVDTWRSPVLLVHGDDDENVAMGGSVAIGKQLRERGVRVDALVLPDEIHGILRYESWSRIGEATAHFFDETLGSGRE